jgi:hypothetical protein
MAVLSSLFILVATSSCGRLGQSDEQAQVTQAFSAWKNAVVNQRINQALAYIPVHVGDYLNALNSEAANPVSSPNPATSPSPGVDLLLRTALEKKVPADLRPHLTLGTLMQRIADRHLFNPRDVREIALGSESRQRSSLLPGNSNRAPSSVSQRGRFLEDRRHGAFALCRSADAGGSRH